MIVVDTSVWIDYFNGLSSAETDELDRALENDGVAMGDLIFLEILQGFRSDSEYDKASTMLGVLEQFAMLRPDSVATCAANYRYLRQQGITIRKTADVIIATFCIEHDFPLLFSERDFLPFVNLLGLISALN